MRLFAFRFTTPVDFVSTAHGYRTQQFVRVRGSARRRVLIELSRVVAEIRVAAPVASVHDPISYCTCWLGQHTYMAANPPLQLLFAQQSRYNMYKVI